MEYINQVANGEYGQINPFAIPAVEEEIEWKIEKSREMERHSHCINEEKGNGLALFDVLEAIDE